MKRKVKVMSLVLSSIILGYMMNSLIFSHYAYTKNEYVLNFIKRRKKVKIVNNITVTYNPYVGKAKIGFRK